MSHPTSASGDPSTPTTSSDTEALRTRWARRLLAVGVALGLVGAVVTGLLGVPGQVGVMIVLLGGSFGAALAAVSLFVTALVDEFRGEAVPGRRLLWGMAAFAGAVVLLIALLGMDP